MNSCCFDESFYYLVIHVTYLATKSIKDICNTIMRTICCMFSCCNIYHIGAFFYMFLLFSFLIFESRRIPLISSSTVLLEGSLIALIILSVGSQKEVFLVSFFSTPIIHFGQDFALYKDYILKKFLVSITNR